MIKNIVFDMGGVLIDWNPQLFLDQYDLSDDDKQLLMNEVFKSYYWGLMDFGELSVEEAIFQMQKNLPLRLKKYISELTLNWPTLSKPIEGMYQLVCKLKENGYNLFLLSNAANNQPEYWKRFPYYFIFENKIISAFAHCAKPEKEIYQLLCSTYNIKAEETVFIDDTQMNVAGAVRCNMKGIVFFNSQQLVQKLRELEINI